MPLLKPKTNRNYVRVLSDGSIRRKVSPDTEGAELRKWKLADGTMGETWELVYENIEGRIKKVWFSDTQFGPQVNATFTDGEDDVTLTINLQSRFADDFMKKLPSVDFSQPVALVPYSFEDDKGKRRTGITFYQDDDKLTNYFYDYDEKMAIRGFPEPAGDEETTDDWKIYFLSVRKFLRKYITENVVPMFESAPAGTTEREEQDSYDAEDGESDCVTADAGDGIAF